MFNILSSAVIGIEARPITVEADVSPGMPNFNIVGLPDVSVKEARDRIRAAIKNSRFSFPRTRVTVNLAPADIKKQGSSFDLPIALAILLAQGEFDRTDLDKTLFLGELALDGQVRPVTGVLTSALMAKNLGYMTIFVPEQNIQEALAVGKLRVLPATSLLSVVEHLKNINAIPEAIPVKMNKVCLDSYIDFKHIKGQEQAKRGLEIAAAGGHNVLLKGPPGTGKTLLARSLPSILPPLTHEESLEVTSIASVAGTLPIQGGLIRERPFRTPHHSCSAISLVGGGTWPRPGEVTLAHRGVLFLDELAEFSRHVLEHLRQPLEDGFVHVSRAAASVRFPSRFLLMAATNPCPCGYASDPHRACICSARNISQYRKRISGPLLDRFDLIIEVPNVEVDKLMGEKDAEDSKTIRQRVGVARRLQEKRYKKTNYLTNAEIPTSSLKQHCEIEKEGTALLKQALDAQRLSARGFTRVKKVARTIADLAGEEMITATHIAEALRYRPAELFD
ncbi:YifB family Mg chelatase-like AAA ATPase [Patescibacteria group bacterium]|nr:YifB family Mg chelatase-like AAA ATPase [Patescibacteria group bacterium]MBU1705478.1 YifB family Mg chelatase-like AAA ATPase [Patescibacteria group bacterium]